MKKNRLFAILIAFFTFSLLCSELESRPCVLRLALTVGGRYSVEKD